MNVQIEESEPGLYSSWVVTDTDVHLTHIPTASEDTDSSF